MQLIDLKTAFLGFSKESVYEYVDSLQKDYSKKLDEKDQHFNEQMKCESQKNEQLQKQLQQLQVEYEQLQQTTQHLQYEKSELEEKLKKYQEIESRIDEMRNNMSMIFDDIERMLKDKKSEPEQIDFQQDIFDEYTKTNMDLFKRNQYED